MRNRQAGWHVHAQSSYTTKSLFEETHLWADRKSHHISHSISGRIWKIFEETCRNGWHPKYFSSSVDASKKKLADIFVQMMIQRNKIRVNSAKTHVAACIAMQLYRAKKFKEMCAPGESCCDTKCLWNQAQAKQSCERDYRVPGKASIRKKTLSTAWFAMQQTALDTTRNILQSCLEQRTPTGCSGSSLCLLQQPVHDPYPCEMPRQMAFPVLLLRALRPLPEKDARC